MASLPALPRALFALTIAVVTVAACGGSSSTGLFSPPCVLDGSVCVETEEQSPAPTPEGGATAARPDAAADTGSESDGATFGPCRRDVECTTGICNWALELCAVAAPLGNKCRRDRECASNLCNWELEACSTPAPIGGACRRDTECASGLCNWKLETCSTKQPKGGVCRRDVECATGVCNQALESCQ